MIYTQSEPRRLWGIYAMLNDITKRFAADCLAAFTKHAARPKSPTPAPLSISDPVQIMRISTESDNNGMNPKQLQHNKITHFPTSQERAAALDLVKWCFSVAKLPADSPRFNWHVSRWDVPNKIARAKADGSFYDLIANCPLIDPAWLRFAPGALEEHRQFIASHQPKNKAAKLSAKLARVAQLVLAITSSFAIVADFE